MTPFLRSGCTLALVVACLGAVASCGGKPAQTSTGELLGDYTTTDAGPLRELYFPDATHYGMRLEPCSAQDSGSCIEYGTYVFEAPYDHLELTNAVTQATVNLPFKLLSAVSASDATGFTTMHASGTLETKDWTGSLVSGLDPTLNGKWFANAFVTVLSMNSDGQALTHDGSKPLTTFPTTIAGCKAQASPGPGAMCGPCGGGKSCGFGPFACLADAPGSQTGVCVWDPP